ncbi:hypothetical protein K1T35_25220 [Pseudonocardia sp. DSM 110487]|uniref:hypothetical protein n=1 Tax=Pseudonocardia sp. DSM 110487 TaxID=2865833 RepID=UPI001C6A264D|nr:hypothetical protein [Pseudonocardia sp. DSM 110487]QYN31934.1 hypothetical protein K1T35_25220 [Pseudonocardia sp. DSM 110487]
MDRGYEGDSGYLAHLGSAAGTDRWDARAGGSFERGVDHPVDRAVDRGGDDAAAGVARRLQARLDRHIWLLERLQAEQLYPEPPGLPELQDTARRMHRDVEGLLLLAGHEPGVRSAGPRRLGDVVSDAAALAEEPRRIEVRSAPSALVSPAAAVELVHVLAELVDHVTAVYPGARIELASHLDTAASRSSGNGGATVDVIVDGAARYDPDGLGGRRAAAAAEQLARHSRHGIVLRRPSGGPPPAGSGLVASVHCPPAAVTVEQPPRPSPPLSPPLLPPPSPRLSPPPSPSPAPPPLPSPEPLLDRTGLSSLSSYELGFDAGAGVGRAVNGTNGSKQAGSSSDEPINGTRPSLSFDDAPAYSPSSSSQVDELFGPLLDLPLEPIDDRYATPIFEAIASAWFREDGSGGGPGSSSPLDWQTPQDDEWREAAARAARPEPELPTTSSGLPRRRPGNQLVPPPRSTERNGQTGQNGQNGQNGAQHVTPAERAPDRVRDRLSTYQRGLREGRHRAVGSDGGTEAEDW